MYPSPHSLPLYTCTNPLALTSALRNAFALFLPFSYRECRMSASLSLRTNACMRVERATTRRTSDLLSFLSSLFLHRFCWCDLSLPILLPVSPLYIYACSHSRAHTHTDHPAHPLALTPRSLSHATDSCLLLAHSVCLPVTRSPAQRTPPARTSFSFVVSHRHR